jgi:hypothetical protein
MIDTYPFAAALADARRHELMARADQHRRGAGDHPQDARWRGALRRRRRPGSVRLPKWLAISGSRIRPGAGMDSLQRRAGLAAVYVDEPERNAATRSDELHMTASAASM